jgi:hypothetical protein
VNREDWLAAFVHELQRQKPETPRGEALRVANAIYGDGSADPKATVERLTSGRGSVLVPPASAEDDWVRLFVEELKRLHPSTPDSLARTIAVIWQQYGHVDPKQAAELYTKSHAAQTSG